MNDPVFWAAAQIHKHLARGPGRMPEELAWAIDRLRSNQAALESIWQRLQKAQRRGWQLAAAQVQAEMLAQVRDLHNEASQVLYHDHQAARDTVVPTLGSLVAELRQLQVELDDIEILPQRRIIVAKTDPIELEGLHLGPFAIELHLDRLNQHRDSSCFDCVALDPNPASCNEDVTHPHVKELGLCAGDATVPISTALRQGRISDAFCLVRSVLTTYNPNSPYVAIEDWNGVRCNDCECVTNRDDLCFCEGCEKDYCSDCMSTCDVCDHSRCRGCLERDDVSGRYCCTACRQTCRKCGRTVDTDSFVEDTELCPQCHEEETPKPENDHEQQQSTDKSATTTAA